MTYQIKITRQFFGPSKKTEILADMWQTPLTFVTRAEAKAEIDRREAEVYHTAHNESGHPSYRIVKA